MLCLFIPWMTKDVFAFRFVRDANEVTNTFTKFVHDASFFLVRLSVEVTVAALVLVAVFHRFFLCLFTYVLLRHLYFHLYFSVFIYLCFHLYFSVFLCLCFVTPFFYCVFPFFTVFLVNTAFFLLIFCDFMVSYKVTVICVSVLLARWM